MKRRSFLAALFVAPIVSATARAVEDQPEEGPETVEIKGPPFVFENGEMKLNMADIGHVSAGFMHSDNRRATFDIGAGKMTFRA
ncbi:hypothetical protein [Shinella zoogloeoides]